MGEHVFAWVQRCLPTRFLSWLVFKATRVQLPWFKNGLIRAFMRGFSISLEEAEHARPEDFPHFNAFFTRALKADARPLDPAADAMLCPVDGTISQLGRIDGDRIFQAKGHHYTAAELLANETLSKAYDGGSFCTIYLAPYNYHRIHMPMCGRLRSWTLIPGRLFSVNPATARTLPRLFARNERVACHFETAQGPMALVLVGALNVGSMETVWVGQITPPHRRHGLFEFDQAEELSLSRGQEMGRFNMGSTVVLLMPPGSVDWQSDLGPGSVVRMGQRLGNLSKDSDA